VILLVFLHHYKIKDLHPSDLSSFYRKKEKVHTSNDSVFLKELFPEVPPYSSFEKKNH
jgi:hypothetical protein